MTRICANDIHWFVINLDHRKDRWKLITAEAERAFVPIHRFPAFRKEDYNGPPENVQLMMPTPNTLGNWLSHTTAWDEGRVHAPAVGILEDDAMLCADFMARLEYLEDHITWDWDIVFLSGTFHLNPPHWHKDDIGRDVELTSDSHLLRAYGVWSNHGYLVNSQSVGKLLRMMQEVMPQAKGSDHALIQLQPELDCYVMVPGAVWQRDSESDIGHGITRFSAFKALGPYVYQEHMDDFKPQDFDWKEAAK